MSSTKEEGSLPEKKLDDLQYIYTTSKKSEEKKEKKRIEYFAKECEKEIDQMSLVMYVAV